MKTDIFIYCHYICALLTCSTSGESFWSISNSFPDVKYHTLNIPTWGVVLRVCSVRTVLLDFSVYVHGVSHCCRRLRATMTVGRGVAGVGRVVRQPREVESKGRQNKHFKFKKCIFSTLNKF